MVTDKILCKIAKRAKPNLVLKGVPFDIMKNYEAANKAKIKAKIEELRAVSADFRLKTVQRFANILEAKLRESTLVPNQTQLELVTKEFGPEFAVSRQYLNMFTAAFREGRSRQGKLSLLSPEKAIGIAAALDLPYETMLEAVGYRTELDSESLPGAASEVVAIFRKMSKVQQELTLLIMKNIIKVLSKTPDLALNPEQEALLSWYSTADPATKSFILSAIGASKVHSITPRITTEAPPSKDKAPAQAKSPETENQGQTPTSPPSDGVSDIVSLENLGGELERLPAEARDQILAILAQEGVRVKKSAVPHNNKVKHNQKDREPASS